MHVRWASKVESFVWMVRSRSLTSEQLAVGEGEGELGESMVRPFFCFFLQSLCRSGYLKKR